jgi:hypothetical protein
MARNVDEVANFVFVQLTEQEPGIYIYDKRHPDNVRQDKTDLAWERISYNTVTAPLSCTRFKND